MCFCVFGFCGGGGGFSLFWNVKVNIVVLLLGLRRLLGEKIKLLGSRTFLFLYLEREVRGAGVIGRVRRDS